MPDDFTSSADIVLSRWRYIGPIGDLSMAFQVGRHLVKGENLRCSGCLFRCESNRDVSGWSQPITGQALSDRCRDLVVNGNAARNRDNRQAMLPCNAVEMCRRYLALNRTMETYKHERCGFAGIVLSPARCSHRDRRQEKYQSPNMCQRTGPRRWVVIDAFRIDSTAGAALVLAFDEVGRGAIENPRATERKGNKISHV